MVDADDLQINIAIAEVKNLEAALAQANEELEHAEMVTKPEPTTNLFFIVLALAGGLIAGAVLLYVIREKLPATRSE